jgi:hypothetical protein
MYFLNSRSLLLLLTVESYKLLMFDDKLNNFSDVPLKGIPNSKIENDRKKTDIICTIIGGLFALVMFILAFALMNRGRRINI